MRNQILLTAPLGLFFITSTLASDCSQKRGSGAPSGKDLGTLARSKLDFVCTTIAGTTGSGYAGVPIEGFQFWGLNPNAQSTVPAFCKSAFDQIITQCVEKGDFYGGQFVFDGQLFNLTNVMGDKSPAGGNAVSNPGSPPTMPQQNGTPDYDDVICSFGAVSDPTAFGRTRWGEAGADYAITDFNNQWKGDLKNGGLSYVQTLGHFWNGPEFWDCGVQENQCGGGVQTCGDKNSRGAAAHTIKNPAAWLIMNSFSNIHNFYLNQFNSFTDSRGALMTQMDTFSKTFSPVPQDQTNTIKIILDSLIIGYGQLAAYAWNVALKKVLLNYEKFKKNGKLDSDKHGWAKDSSNTFATGMLSMGKDLLPKAKTQLEATQHLNELMGAIVDEYANVTAQYVESLFAGDDKGVDAITNTINDGKWIDAAFVSEKQLNNVEMEGIAAKVFYGSLIPAAWTQVGGLHPIIVFDDKICTDSPQNNDGDRYISKQDQDKTGICYKGLGMWLLSVNDDTRMGPPIRGGGPDHRIERRTYGYPPTTHTHTQEADTATLERRRLIAPDTDPFIFDLLPGGSKDTLNGNDFGGITIDDIIISSYEAYIANGNKNGYKLDPENTDQLKKSDGTTNGDTLFPSGVRTPGVFNFPVCSVDTAIKNWQKGWKSKPEFYPCN